MVDFLITHNNKKYLIEVKGYFKKNKKELEEYLDLLYRIILYCKENNLRFVFTFSSDFKEKDLIDCDITDFRKNEIKQILQNKGTKNDKD